MTVPQHTYTRRLHPRPSASVTWPYAFSTASCFDRPHLAVRELILVSRGSVIMSPEQSTAWTGETDRPPKYSGVLAAQMLPWWVLTLCHLSAVRC